MFGLIELSTGLMRANSASGAPTMIAIVPASGAVRAAAHRRVDQRDAARRELGRHRARRGRVAGRHVDDDCCPA